jgi:hypothetical protein
MDILFLVALLAIGFQLLKSRDQKRRVALLSSYLGNYQIEHLMENLTEGYLRCLGESDPERRDQIWGLLATSEQTLVGQFQRFTAEFAKVNEDEARVSKFPLALPFVLKLFPSASFDMRAALTVHARGIADTAANAAGRSPRDKAYMLSAELFLMQHTCHWFCRSKAVASARLLARHKTSYAQVLDAVSPATRQAYQALIA